MFKALSIALHKDSSFEVISEFCNFLLESSINGKLISKQEVLVNSSRVDKKT